MRILLTNRSLEVRGGSELYVRDVACALVRRGLQPIVYSPRLGAVSDDLRAGSVPVVDRLDRIGEPPDLIHGQHHLQTMAALLRFAEVPAIFFCHGWLPWDEKPPRFPRILRHVAVDRLRRERLVTEEGIDPARVEVIPNFVDLRRFTRRPDPLPPRPRRALVFGNQASPAAPHVEAVRQACRREGIELEIVGFGSGTTVARPEEILYGFDLVFARGRSAMEAMASGAAVILCDAEGLGPLVTPHTVESLAEWNFGVGALTGRLGIDELRRQIGRYDPAEAAAVCEWIHERCPLEAAVDRLTDLYSGVVAEWKTLSADARGTVGGAAASLYLEDLTAVVNRQEDVITRLHGERDHLGREREALRGERDALRNDLDFLVRTRALRARQALLRLRRRGRLPPEHDSSG